MKKINSIVPPYIYFISLFIFYYAYSPFFSFGFLQKFYCRNLSLGLTTKARACKVLGKEGSPGVRSHAPGSARKCEGIDPHTPKGTSTLGVGVLVDSRMFRE
jgi:hypothetical protein